MISGSAGQEGPGVRIPQPPTGRPTRFAQIRGFFSAVKGVGPPCRGSGGNRQLLFDISRICRHARDISCQISETVQDRTKVLVLIEVTYTLFIGTNISDLG